ncbi:MAG: hypothetical protein FAF05_00260 [Epsilonproteobacteria bacterium]|nr:hypothetical protein [Campylobacterota bacterium]
MDERKKQLIADIQDLLNKHGRITETSINPDLLDFMDKDTLIDIIDSLLMQKEKEVKEIDTEWLEQFKEK